jgi:hypothetical protein
VGIDEIRATGMTAGLKTLSRFLGATGLPSGEVQLKEIYHEPLKPSLTNLQQAILAGITAGDTARLIDTVPFATESWEKRSGDITETGSSAEAEAEGDVIFRKLLRWTESVGDNCEYGFVQRYEDYEPSSLFRWAVTPIDKLVAYLNKPIPLFLKENLQTTSSDLVLDTLSGFYFHSHTNVEDGESRRFITEDEGFSRIHENEVDKINYLSSKLFSNLRSNPGIYIYKRNNPVSAEEFMELALTIKGFNPDHVVLWVKSDDALTLERLAEGIYAGTIRKFADYHTANLIDLPSWTDLLKLLYEEKAVKSMVDKAFS